MISPADLIPIAEKTGTILQLGRWVLQEACRQLKEWQNSPHISKNLWISVNLSASQFAHPSLVKEIREVLLEADLDANRLMLELTEGMAMENPEFSQSLLMQLRVMGVRIAIDDFGTGYSSPSYLRRFPLDYLKIDHLFVKSIENKPDSREMIRAVYTLAHQLGLQVIAEGIENAWQLDLIRSIGCEYGQGFLYSKPARSELVETLLQDGFAFGEDGLPLKSQIEVEGTQNGPWCIIINRSASRRSEQQGLPQAAPCAQEKMEPYSINSPHPAIHGRLDCQIRPFNFSTHCIHFHIDSSNRG
jgi:EAL domain-containing protein (putative c-di-GMP-specific phosphodiesterase class I)